MHMFTKPYEDYIKCLASVYVRKSKEWFTDIKCYLWLPNEPKGEPHIYLLLDKFKNREECFVLNYPQQVIDVEINIETMNGEACKTHLLKKMHFHTSSSTVIAKDWNESVFHYSFPKHVITKHLNQERSEQTFRFFITESKLLKSNVYARQHETGELSRNVISHISLSEELAHLGIRCIQTDHYIGNNPSYLIEIIPEVPVDNMLRFYKRVQPIFELILLITSFAEGRRLNWYKCDGHIGLNFVEIYNSRTTYYNDNINSTMKNERFFRIFLKHSMKMITPDRVRFISKTLKTFMSTKDFSAEASIVLWFSILEKVLKDEFGKDGKKKKEIFLAKMGVHLFGYPPLQEMISMRTQCAHGDDLNSDKLFTMYLFWEKLMIELLYRVLKWDRSIEMQVYVDSD